MNTKTQTVRFLPKDGATAEYHFLITVKNPALSYARQLDAVLRACHAASQGLTVHFRRFFLSDAANQAWLLEEALRTRPYVPTSIVQQAPLDGTRIALWMYGTDPMDCESGVPTHNGFAHHWASSLTAKGTDSYTQMERIFRDFDRSLGGKGLSLNHDTIRTWIFVRDVDTNYAGVVKGRREYFAQVGLTPETHFIASTGIEGRHPDPHYFVEMDAYSVAGLKQKQISFLKARSHLSPTYDYGVTFERGTAVTYGDRRQVYISGTASIDASGQVLFPGNVAAQTERMLDNVSTLLSEAGADMADIASAIVYLRDPADIATVRQVIAQSCPNLPALYVHGPVCRPSWLVEMECIALTRAGNPAFPAF